MLRISRLPSPLLFVVFVVATLSTRRGRLRGGHYDLAERYNGLGGQEEDRDVDTCDVFSYLVWRGFVEMGERPIHLGA